MKKTIQDVLSDYQKLPEYRFQVLNDVNQISEFGDRPIHTAAVRGQVEDIELLIENGASVNLTGEHEYTALHFAVLHGNLEAVSLLLKAGSDLAKKNDDGQTPLALARICRDIDKPDDREKIILLLESLTGSVS